MAHTIMIIPIGTGVGVTSISLGLVRAFAREGVKVSFFKPVAQPKPSYIGPEASTAVIKAGTDLDLPEPIEVSRMETLLSSGDDSTLLEEIIANFENHAAASGADVIIVVYRVLALPSFLLLRILLMAFIVPHSWSYACTLETMKKTMDATSANLWA